MRYSSTAGRWVIAATVLGSAMASIDATVVGIALPSIGRELHTSLGPLQWVVTGYTLTLAAFLLPAGALGDQRGRRRVFQIGVVGFTVASTLCALAPNATFLIVTRLLQGVGGALLVPESLAIIQASFDEKSRAQAIGAWSGLGGVATAVGPLLGGYLVSVASWRLIFLINVPIGAIVLWLTARHVPESRDASAAGVDVPGSALAVVALAGLTYGFIEGPATGWTQAAVIGMLVVGALVGVAFFIVEQRVSNPMLPLHLVGQRQFSVTNMVTFAVYSALSGMLFLLPVQLQVGDGYTPLESGLALLPLTLIMLGLSARSGRLAARIGPRLQMSVGPVIVGAGLALLRTVTTDHGYFSGVLPAMVVFGLGLAVTVAPLTVTALGSVPEEHAGLASAVNNDVSRLGGLLAVAVLPALAGISGGAYLHASTLSAGFRTAATISAVVCASGGVVAAVGIRNPAPAEKTPLTHCALDAAPLLTEEGPVSRQRPG